MRNLEVAYGLMMRLRSLIRRGPNTERAADSRMEFDGRYLPVIACNAL